MENRIMIRPSFRALAPSSVVLSLSLITACEPAANGAEATTPMMTPAPQSAEACAPDNGGITLPEGFCAIVFADSLGRARHLEVASNGDVLVALRNVRNRDRSVTPGGVVVLRDSDGDGVADMEERWGVTGGNEVLLDGETLYFAPDDAVLRYTLPAGSMTPSAGPDTVVSGLPADRNHTAKSLAVDDAGNIYVNIGAPSNACQETPRSQESPGLDPCPQLDDRGGVWRFSGAAMHQAQTDGMRFATGLRNVVALRQNPTTGTLFGVVHGRDSLAELWPELFTTDQRVEKPSEEFVTLREGNDYGWPYCFHDPETNAKVLAPEYGGDGAEVGRCADMEMPLVGFPAHWAPNDLEFYTGTQFPVEFRGGAFIAFHGSWNRAPAPQAGYNLVFVPMAGDQVIGDWQVFADGFAGENVSPRDAAHRPVGVALGPDGSLYVSDSQSGRIWKIIYVGA
jgi:glucose/arabinose dehydrogenase